MLATVPGLACGMHVLEQSLSSYLRGAAMYPAAWYPEGNVLLLVTPSIQITCYLASGLGALVLICWMLFLRARWQWRALEKSRCNSE